MELIPAKTIVTRTKSTAWFGTRYNMNLYRGCPHGCIYCDSRSECYHVSDFPTVKGKKDALQIVRNDLRRKAVPGVIGTGAMSDPYNPEEKREELTRHALELVSAYGFGIAVATKSDLIVRDIDIFKEIRQAMPVLCKISITTIDDNLAKKVEPFAPSPSRRFEAVRALSENGIFTGVLLMPVLPFLEDNEENIEGIVTRAKQCGARFVYPMFGLTMRPGQREYFYKCLEDAFPGQGLPAKYDRKYAGRYACMSPRVKGLWNLFTSECTKLGLLYEMKDIIRAYKLGYQDEQLTFFK